RRRPRKGARPQTTPFEALRSTSATWPESSPGARSSLPSPGPEGTGRRGPVDVVRDQAPRQGQGKWPGPRLGSRAATAPRGPVARPADIDGDPRRLRHDEVRAVHDTPRRHDAV